MRSCSAVVLLLAGSAAVSILVLRSVMPARLDEEFEARLRQELEEFDLLRSASTPAAAWRPLTCRCRSNSYVAPEVADEGEMLLAFVAHLPYESARAQQG